MVTEFVIDSKHFSLTIFEWNVLYNWLVLHPCTSQGSECREDKEVFTILYCSTPPQELDSTSVLLSVKLNIKMSEQIFS